MRQTLSGDHDRYRAALLPWRIKPARRANWGASVARKDPAGIVVLAL
jgi:hypothetical protein